ncbi:hypothetical protein [Rhodococcus sp. 06-235-1A]|uniref:hypothetical protein n=1 Tax=Rhodococcus sp. 06-235-1A TaxID=2022508 RepID=UPI0015C5CC0F|nr:hypothetical protein [Rhodococcus sp. 06-235-1A]
MRPSADLLAADVRPVGQATAACGRQGGAATAFVGGTSDHRAALQLDGSRQCRWSSTVTTVDK